MHPRTLLKIACVLALCLLGIGAATAQARYLPTYLAKAAMRTDNRKAEREAEMGIVGTTFGECGRPDLSRYECQVQLEGHRPLRYSYETGIVYEYIACAWVSVAKWQWQIVAVKRRELSCERWEEASR